MEESANQITSCLNNFLWWSDRSASIVIDNFLTLINDEGSLSFRIPDLSIKTSSTNKIGQSSVTRVTIAENLSEGIPHISRTSWQRMSTFSTPFNNDSRHFNTNWAGLFPSCIESWQVALLQWKQSMLTTCDKNDRMNRCLSFFLPLHTSSNLLSPLYRIHSRAKNSNISSNKHGYRCQFQFINVLSHS